MALDQTTICFIFFPIILTSSLLLVNFFYNCITHIKSPCDLYAFISISGNTEIGNGYGVPGGGAYNDVPKLNADDAGKFHSKIILVIHCILSTLQ